MLLKTASSDALVEKMQTTNARKDAIKSTFKPHCLSKKNSMNLQDLLSFNHYEKAFYGMFLRKKGRDLLFF